VADDLELLAEQRVIAGYTNIPNTMASNARVDLTQQSTMCPLLDWLAHLFLLLV
jgi:hypothetical protein